MAKSDEMMRSGGVPAKFKEVVRRHVGFSRIMEWRNKVVMGPSVWAIRRFENAEVARLSTLLAGRNLSARVACVVPTYRRPVRLLKAIESILGQTLEDLVVVVVDDGGGLPELPEDPRVIGVSLSRNIGIAGVVRNVGIRLTTSTYVAFLDDDNTWRPDHLDVCVGALERGADLVYSALARRTATGEQFDVISRAFDRQALAQESFVDTSAIVVRRVEGVTFSRLPRNRNTLPGEDWEFVFRLSRTLRVEHIPSVTIDYLMNPESFYTPWGT